MSLSPQPARTDLTDRECAKIIGGLIGSLCLMADRDQVRKAVQWWAEQDAAWSSFPKTAQEAAALATNQAARIFQQDRPK